MAAPSAPTSLKPCGRAGPTKALAKRTAESNARVQAEIERIKALHTPEAAAARAADMAAFQARFFPARRSYGYRRAA